MFVTYSNSIQGHFNGIDGTRLLWNSVQLNPNDCYFLVEGCGLVDGCFGPWARLVSDVKELDSLCNGERIEVHSINQIQLLAPSAMTKRSGISVEVLSDIRIQPGTESGPVYEFVTKSGDVYTSARK